MDAADLAGRVALVTGGASGIGAAVCRLLSGHGVHVAVCDMDGERGGLLAAELGGLFVHTDVRDRSSMAAAVAATAARWGRLDIAALNAGTASAMPHNAVEPLDLDWYRQITAVNVDGVVFGIEAVLPAMRDTGGGTVVATASLAGLVPLPADPFYTMTKTAVVGLVRALAPGLAAHGVLVNALCPGFADTPMLAAHRDRFTSSGFPLLDAGDVAAAFLSVVLDGGTGQAWFVQPGRDPAPYRFRGVPGPRVPEGDAPAPPDLKGADPR